MKLDGRHWAMWPAWIALLLAACSGREDHLQAAARAAIAQDAPTLTLHDGVWTAVNRSQGFRVSVGGSGATLAKLAAGTDTRSGWTAGLHVARVGRGEAQLQLVDAAPRGASGSGARLTIARGNGITEWFEHDARGLEHGVDIATSPPGDGLLRIVVAVAGLTPRLADDGERVELLDAAGETALSYGRLAVRDADGRPVPATMEVDGGSILIVAQDARARYPLEVDPLAWGQYQTLVPSDGVAGDNFGCSVSVSGTIAIVGACKKTIGSNANQGAAYIFVQNGFGWVQQQELLASDGATSDHFGGSVSIDGTTAIIGAYNKTVGSNSAQGAAYVFVQSGSTWTQQQELLPSDGLIGDEFGMSVSISGTTAVIGASQTSNYVMNGPGKAYVFVQNGSTWTQQQKLVASDGAAVDYFGWSVAISGTTVVVGAPWHQVGSNRLQGAVYAFVQNGSTWTQQQELVASNGANGDCLGQSVSISGTTAIAGATYLGQSVGAYLFVQNGASWKQQEFANPGNGNTFGNSVSISGATAIVGAQGVSAGDAYLFVDGDVGAPCTSPAQCLFGFCVDGVCCNNACGGGVATDCQACSIAAGGPADGTCSPSYAAFVCGPRSNLCALPAKCDGVDLTCPANSPAPSGTVCAAASECLQQSVCNGSSETCPIGVPVSDGTSCTGGVCVGGSCAQCGGNGQPCCAGGACTAPLTCGGGGTVGQCGCAPITTCPAADQCGAIPDGCGGTVACGTCGTGLACIGHQCEAGPVDAGMDSTSSSDDSGYVGEGGDDSAANDASSGDGGTASGQSGGCGCRTAQRQDAAHPLFWLGVVGLVGLRRRRRVGSPSASLAYQTEVSRRRRRP